MELNYFDKVYCICMEDQPAKRTRLLGQLKLFYPTLEPTVFNAISTRHLKNHHIGCALSHRAVVESAKKKGYRRILVLEEDALLHKNFKFLLDHTSRELEPLPWNVFYLGACIWETKASKPNRVFKKVRGAPHLEIPTGCTCTHGIAYNELIYDYLLEKWPDNIDDMKLWCKKHAAIDQWLMYHLQGGGANRNQLGASNTLMCSPRACTQPFLTGKNKQDKPADFLNA